MRGSARAARGVCVAVAMLGIGSGLGGCGAVETLTSTPTITEHTSTPDAVLATPAGAGSTSGASGAAVPEGSPGASGGQPGGQPGGHPAVPGVLAPSERLVEVADRGVAFAVPAGYAAVDPQERLTADRENPVLEQLADQLGVSAADLSSAIADRLDLILIESPAVGFATNVIVSPSPPGIDAGTLQRQLAQTFGIETGEARGVPTALGEAVRIDYALPEITPGAHGSVLLVPGAAPGGVMVTVSAGSKELADALADRIASTLRAG